MRSKILLLLVIVLLIAPTVYAGSFSVGWLKAKLGVDKPDYQCYVTIDKEDEYCRSLYVNTKHICQLYKGYNPKKSVESQCAFCEDRSELIEQYGSCVVSGVEKSYFADEDFEEIVNDAEFEYDEQIANLPVMQTLTFTWMDKKVSVIKGYNEKVYYTSNGKDYTNDKFEVFDKKSSTFDWFTSIFKRKLSDEEKVVFDVYEQYKGKSQKELEEVYEKYTDLIGGPKGADFPAKAIIELLKQGKKETFLKAVKSYSEERKVYSVKNIRTQYNEGDFPWIEHLSISRDFQQDAYLAILEEAYQRTQILKQY